MTDSYDPDFFADPARSAPAPTVAVMTDVPLDPRLAALRDGTAPTTATDRPARQRRIAQMERETLDYARALEELDRLIDHLHTAPDVRPEIINVAAAHLTERRERVRRSWVQIAADLDTLRRAGF